MNEQVQQQLADYLKDFVGAMKAGGEFAMAQAPLIVQEKIAYGRAIETGWLLVGLATLAACVAVARLLPSAIKAASDADYASDGPLVAKVVVLGMSAVGLGLAGILTTLNQMQMVAQVWFAPRLYILEWAASLLKEAK